MTRKELYTAITAAGVALHPCNAADTAPTDDTAIYYLDTEELTGIYADITDEQTADTKEEQTENNMNNVKVVFEKKEGRNYIETWRSTDPVEVYKRLSNVLVSKKLCSCTWVKSIKRVQRYTHVEIIVTYDHGGRDIFTVPTH